MSTIPIDNNLSTYTNNGKIKSYPQAKVAFSSFILLPFILLAYEK